jgi:pimeloyl-ACP methyl ester carboxylesterase
MLTKLLWTLPISAAIYLMIALGLVVSQRPSAPEPGEGTGIAFDEAVSAGLEGLPDLLPYTARDGETLFFRRYASARPSDRLVVLVHGSGWHGMQFHRMAGEIAAQGLADVVVPDLRGHGPAPQRRGDIDHVGQFEEDLADLIDRTRGDAKQVVLGGHSSGGGLVVRFAGGAYGQKADAFILLAPFLKHDAPTTRANSGGWAHPAVRRIVGLTMLNMVGIRLLDHLPVIAFAMPRAVLDGPYGATATTRYSHRLLIGFSPRPDCGADLAAIDRPLLVVAGTADESFRAELYEPTIVPHTGTGTYAALDGVTHMGVVFGNRGIAAVTGWLSGLPEV